MSYNYYDWSHLLRGLRTRTQATLSGKEVGPNSDLTLNLYYRTNLRSSSQVARYSDNEQHFFMVAYVSVPFNILCGQKYAYITLRFTGLPPPPVQFWVICTWFWIPGPPTFLMNTLKNAGLGERLDIWYSLLSWHHGMHVGEHTAEGGVMVWFES